MKMTINRLDSIRGRLRAGAGINTPRGAAGFTLVELMIVVVIVAVLLGVGLPAYQDQVIRSHRAAAKAEMLDIANRQQQFLLANRDFANRTTFEANGYSFDDDVAKNYTYDISTLSGGNAPYFIITFTAIGRQALDGDLTLDSEGERTPEELWNR